MFTPYKTVFQSVPFAPSERQVWGAHPKWQQRSHKYRKKENSQTLIIQTPLWCWGHQEQGATLARCRGSDGAPACPFQPRGGILPLPQQSHTQSKQHCRWLHHVALLPSHSHTQVCLHTCWHRGTYFWSFHLLQRCIRGKYIHPAAVNHHFTMDIYLYYYCNADILNH